MMCIQEELFLAHEGGLNTFSKQALIVYTGPNIVPVKDEHGLLELALTQAAQVIHHTYYRLEIVTQYCIRPIVCLKVAW